MTTTFQDLLAQLAEHLNLPAQALIEQQEIVIDDVAIHLQCDAGDAHEGGVQTEALVLSCYLGTPSEARWREIAHTVLRANHLWVGTAGGTLGMLPDNDDITWCLRWPLPSLDAAQLAELLHHTTALAQAWRYYIEQEAPTASDPTDLHGMAFAMQLRA